MSSKSASYAFLPAVKVGLGALADADDLAAGLADAPVELKLGWSGTSEEAEHKILLRGAGDVFSIASSQIVRKEPTTNARSVEPNYLPFVEFARADFPWLFSPATPDSAGRLRPWIALVVVRDGEHSFSESRSGPSILEVDEDQVVTELPSLGDWQSTFWAHVCVSGALPSDGDTGVPDAELVAVIGNSPERVVSRLICPRRLDPFTRYRACLVPTFRAGVEAGLGQDVESATAYDPAWGSGAATLPVYAEWEFTTGEEGDFESLVKQLRPRVMPPEVGYRLIDGSSPGRGLPNVNEDELVYGGVLVSPQADTDYVGERQASDDFKPAIHNLVNEAGEFKYDSVNDPAISPPIYGRWHRGVEAIAPDLSETWIVQFNEEPTLRMVGAIGTRVIQQQQESLMAAAWEQAGSAREANDILARAMLARESSESLIRRHVDGLREAAQVQLLSPAHSRSLGDGQTLRAQLLSTSLPKGIASAALRRSLRPGGAVGRIARLDGTAAPTAADILELFERDALSERGGSVATVLNAELPDVPKGTMTAANARPRRLRAAMKQLFDPNLMGPLLADWTVGQGFPQDWQWVLPPDVQGYSRPLSFDDISAALEETWTWFHSFTEDSRVPEAMAYQLGDVHEHLRVSIDPGAALVKRVQLRIQGREDFWLRVEPLGPMLTPPLFHTPMYVYYRDLGEEWFAPGLEHVVDETVTLLLTNGPTIESYMVALSHEMGRELLWREFAVDMRGTYFQAFWNGWSSFTSGFAEQPPRADIGMIHEWADGEIGSHLITAGEADDEGGDGLLVLLIRGELLRRYPDAVIYATAGTDPSEEDFYPIFSGELGNDIAFHGFAFDKQTAKDEGYLFVIEQQPTAPRFGLDLTGSVEEDWSNASWEWAESESQVAEGHLMLSPVTHPSGTSDIAKWGQDAAQMAEILLQRPVRVFIPAKEMLE